MAVTVDERALAAAFWWRGLRETNNATFLPLFFDESRYLVLCGGGGSGKSIFAGRKVLERCATEPGHRFLVCRKVGRTLRESCYRQLVGQAREFYDGDVAQVYLSELRIVFKNGSEILFAGLDDVEKLKSIYNITSIWVEEASEILESDFNQLDIRLRGKTVNYQQIILSFNPVSILHWLKIRFFDGGTAAGASPRPTGREGKGEDGGRGEDGDGALSVRTHRSNYRDNRFLPPENAAVLEAFRETDEYYYTVYCLGEWGVLGKSVFDAKAVTARLREDVQPVRVGYFAGEWTDDADGFIRIYEAPAEGVPYVIGADTAGEGSDRFVAQVIDNTTGRQVAVLLQKTDEDVFAKQLAALGHYYNTALIGVETNYSTYPIMELERLGYPKQYVRETVDDYTHKPRQSYGFRTDSKTRPIIISELIRAVRDDISIVSDKDTLEEMLTFVRNESFRPEAEAGARDDCVMALAIAHHIRPQQNYLKSVPKAERVRWTEDQYEDYRNANAEGRRLLVERWGSPW